jgi:hypothetical protein
VRLPLSANYKAETVSSNTSGIAAEPASYPCGDGVPNTIILERKKVFKLTLRVVIDVELSNRALSAVNDMGGTSGKPEGDQPVIIAGLPMYNDGRHGDPPN